DPRYVGIGKGPSDDHNARAACGHETAEGAPDAARSANDGNLQSLEVEARSIDATPCKALVSLHRVRVPLAPPTAHRCAAIEPSTHSPTASFMSAFTLGTANGISGMGQKQTKRQVREMSDFPPKADLCAATRDVRYGPIADIAPFIRSPRPHGFAPTAER